MQGLLEGLHRLESEVKELQGQLRKDSHNSSKRASSDGFGKRSRSLRQKSDRPSGGQAGHPGQTLEWRSEPDMVEGFAANPLPPPPKEPRKQRGRIRRSTPRNLLERLKTHQVPVLRFIHDFTVPFDNNQAERDLRMMKLKQKISGGFRSQDGARCFCRIRGYLATLHKQNRNLLDALLNLFSGNPQSPLPQPE